MKAQKTVTSQCAQKLHYDAVDVAAPLDREALCVLCSNPGSIGIKLAAISTIRVTMHTH
jgi:hypothetical protein